MDRRSWLPEDLRSYHRGLLLRLLGEEGPLTRRDLAQRSGLSIPTAASIVSGLLGAGQIVETSPRSDRMAPRRTPAGLAALPRHAHLVMALAEARHGLGMRAENLLYVHLGESFGVAFVVDGLAFRQGAHGVSELGHQRVVEDGPKCSCGAEGCLEAVLGTSYLRQRIRAAARESKVLTPLVRRRLPVLELLDIAVRGGDAAAAAILDDVITHLSTAVAVSVDMLSPTRVALGGELATAPKDVLDRLQDASRAKVSRVLRDQVRIERSEIGRYPGVLGAGPVALDRPVYPHQPPGTPTRGSPRPPPAWGGG